MAWANLNSTAKVDAVCAHASTLQSSQEHTEMASSIRKHISQARGSRARIARVIVVLAFAFTYTAACDVHGLSEPGTLSTLSISPNPQTLQINGSQQFTAVGKDFS